jgi:hypothetical protein
MYSRRKPFEELPEEMTAVWTCTDEGCNGWMRDNFTFDDQPTCPKCQSPMVSGMRSLPLVVNTNRNQKKNTKKGVSIN